MWRVASSVIHDENDGDGAKSNLTVTHTHNLRATVAYMFSEIPNAPHPQFDDEVSKI